MEPGPSALPKRRKKKKADAPEDPSVDISDMDADIATKRVVDSEEWDGTEEMRKRKLDEYMEEIYGMDFNDMVRQYSIIHIYNLLTSLLRRGECRHDSLMLRLLHLPSR